MTSSQAQGTEPYNSCSKREQVQAVRESLKLPLPDFALVRSLIKTGLQETSTALKTPKLLLEFKENSKGKT